MCGIAGITVFSASDSAVDEQELLRMRDAMHRRGPDAAGLWIEPSGRVGLAHRRLAIIDLSADGEQPMATADRRYHIVFNGEIYNYLELRTELALEGVRFRSKSDTEVLLYLYARDGEAMCRRLRGMYAFAIWDAVEKTLFLARDPFGIKPLYLHEAAGTLRFASQVKSLLAGGVIPRAIDPESETAYWIWGHVLEPGTLYQGIVALEPGTWLTVGQGRPRRAGLFESVANLLGAQPDPSSTGRKSYGSLRAALLDSVQHHLIADVPVGVFLSAGIDSSTLVALAAECGGTLNTVTVGFEEFRGTVDDETVLAAEVARHYGTRHETVWVGARDFQDAFATFIDSMDQPSIDGLNTWLVSRAAAKLGLKVALSGLGGDEFFGGYPSFRQVPLIRQMTRPLGQIPGLGKMIRRLGLPLLPRQVNIKYASLIEYGASWQGAYLLRRAVRMPWEYGAQSAAQLESRYPIPEYLLTQQNSLGRRARASARNRAVMSYLEATQYMRNQLLRDSDWAGMAHSIEIRVPLVDIELTRHIAEQRRCGLTYSKQNLAAAAHPKLPNSILQRPKTGFAVPVRDWIGAETIGSETVDLRSWQSRILKAQ